MISLSTSRIAARPFSPVSVNGAAPAELDVDQDVERGDNPSISLILIEPRQLMRECIIDQIRRHGEEHAAAFQSLDEWLSSLPGRRTVRPVVILNHLTDECAHGQISAIVGRLAELDHPAQLVIVADTENADSVRRAIEGGARGYASTSLSLDQLMEIVRLVRVGGTYIPPSILLSLAAATTAEEPKSIWLGQLSPRQYAVLSAVQRGKANKVIAYELSMKESTVKVHVRNIMRKIGARNRTEVAIMTSSLGVAEGKSPSS